MCFCSLANQSFLESLWNHFHRVLFSGFDGNRSLVLTDIGPTTPFLDWCHHILEQIFYGFWGKCFNDYMETPPHDGYRIVKEWADSLFSPTFTAAPPALARTGSGRQLGRSTLARPTSTGVLKRSGSVPSLLAPGNSASRAESAGALGAGRRKKSFFVYTSNVDTMFFRSF
jgi:hypothetical protein